MQVFVQFADDTEEVVIASFSCAQDPADYPHQGVVDAGDPRYVAFESTLPKTAF